MDKIKTFMRDEPRKVIEYGWNLINVISTGHCIMALMAALYLDGEDAKGFGFAAIWSMFLIRFMVGIGVYVLGGSARGCGFCNKESEYSTPLLTGFLLGTCIGIALAFFLLGCIFAGSDNGALKGLSAFYFIEFFLLLAFSSNALQKRALIYGPTPIGGGGGGGLDTSDGAATANPAVEEPLPRAVVLEEPYN